MILRYYIKIRFTMTPCELPIKIQKYIIKDSKLR